MDITHLIYPPFRDRHLLSFHFLPIMTNAAINIYTYIFVWTSAVSSLDIGSRSAQGVSSGSCGHSVFQFWRTATLSPQGAVPSFPHQPRGKAPFPSGLQLATCLLVPILFIVGTLEDTKSDLTVLLICISLMTNHVVKHLTTCSLAIGVSSFGGCVHLRNVYFKPFDI